MRSATVNHLAVPQGHGRRPLSASPGAPLSVRICLLAIATVSAFTVSVNAQAQQRKMPPAVVPVETIEAKNVAIFQTFPGTTETNRSVVVRAQVGGILEKRSYTEGDVVKKGDTLFTIDPRPFAAAVHQAEADKTSAEAKLRAAIRDWKRISTLFKRGVASEKDRDDAQSALEIAQADVKVAEAKLEQSKIDLRYTKVVAPIRGIAGLRSVATGNLIQAGDRLMQIDQVDPLQVVLTYSADNPFANSPALNPTPSKPTKATIAGHHDKNGNPIVGEINYRAADVDANTNTIKLRAVFPNPGDAIRPNQFVRIKVEVEKRPNAIVIPETAIASGIRPGSSAVYVVGKDNHVKLTPVELGPSSAAGRIVTKGLKVGQRVVTDGLIKLRPDAEIKPAGATKAK